MMVANSVNVCAQDMTSRPYTSTLSELVSDQQTRKQLAESAKKETISQLRSMGASAAKADELEALPVARLIERLAVSPPVGPSTIAAPRAGASVPAPSVNWITEGGLTTGHPGVALLLAKNDGFDVFGVQCTGTLIRQNVIITAAHCVCYSRDAMANYLTGKECIEGNTNRTRAPLMEPSRWRVFFQHAGVRNVSDVRVNEQYEFSETTVKNDLAILVLERSVHEIDPAAIAPAKTSIGGWNQGSIVGFGYSARPDAAPATFLQQLVSPGLKAEGIVSEAPCTNYRYLEPDGSLCMIYGNDEQGRSAATICNGDSGGPLWVLTEGNPEIGVASGRSAENCAELGTVAFEMAIGANYHRTWIDAQLVNLADDSKKGFWPTFGQNLRHVSDRRNVGVFDDNGKYASDGWLKPMEAGIVLATMNSSGPIRNFRIEDRNGAVLCSGSAGVAGKMPNVNYCSANVLSNTTQYRVAATGDAGEFLQFVITVHPNGTTFD